MQLIFIIQWLSAITATSARVPCSANPTLKATVPGRDLDTMEEVHQHILSCPNIQSLDLRITLLGCSDGPDRWNLPFRLAGGDVYPNLTSLRLEGYIFNQSDWADAFPRNPRYGGIFSWFNFYRLQKWSPLWRDIPKERRHLTNMQLWLEAMDWRKLETLALSGVEEHFVDLAAPYLDGLTSLEVLADRRSSVNTTTRLILSLPEKAKLTTVSLIDGWNPNVLRPLLDRYGKTLRTLNIFSKEPWFLGEDAALSQSQIKAIAARAPNIEHIALTLDRNGSWPWDTLATLATIPSLASADIWLELAADCQRGAFEHEWLSDKQTCMTDDRFRQPRLNASSATEVFEFLKENKVGAELRNVTFYIGDWDRPWDGPLYEPPWLERRKGKVECSVLDKNGLPKKDVDAMCVHVVYEEEKYNSYMGYYPTPLDYILTEEEELEQLRAAMEP